MWRSSTWHAACCFDCGTHVKLCCSWLTSQAAPIAGSTGPHTAGTDEKDQVTSLNLSLLQRACQTWCRHTCPQAALHAATDPARQKPAVRYESHGFASVAELLPRLELCKRLLMEVHDSSPTIRH